MVKAYVKSKLVKFWSKFGRNWSELELNVSYLQDGRRDEGEPTNNDSDNSLTLN